MASHSTSTAARTVGTTTSATTCRRQPGPGWRWPRDRHAPRRPTRRARREGTRYLSATLNRDGLEIFGADRGPGVARFWGEDEYEWQYWIAAEDIPALVAALGGAPGDDVLALLQRQYRDHPVRASSTSSARARCPRRSTVASVTDRQMDLEALLERARTAEPGDRILLRDPIAAFGEAAIDPMADWLGDVRLAAFAIRTLDQIARDPALRPAVIAVLAKSIATSCRTISPATLTWSLGDSGPLRRHVAVRAV